MMKLFGVILLLIYICTMIQALPPTIIKDLKQVEQASPSRISNKVKRAEEVVVFGNQQNKLSDNNYLRTDKRVQLSDIPNLPVPEVQNGVDKEELLLDEEIPIRAMEPLPLSAPNYQTYNKYFYDRPEFDADTFEDRSKRNAYYRHPLFKSNQKFQLDNNINRKKRESDAGLEDLISLLAMYEVERQKQHPSELKSYSRYAQPEFQSYTNDDTNEVEIDDDESEDEGTWLDRPVIASHHYIEKPKFYSTYNEEMANHVPRKPYEDREYLRMFPQLNDNNRQIERRNIKRRFHG